MPSVYMLCTPSYKVSFCVYEFISLLHCEEDGWETLSSLLQVCFLSASWSPLVLMAFVASKTKLLKTLMMQVNIQ